MAQIARSPEVHLWRRVYTYYDEPQAEDMLKLIVAATIKRAKELGKIEKLVSEPKFLTVPTEVENFLKCIVTFEFTMGETFEMAKAKNFKRN